LPLLKRAAVFPDYCFPVFRKCFAVASIRTATDKLCSGLPRAAWAEPTGCRIGIRAALVLEMPKGVFCRSFTVMRPRGPEKAVGAQIIGKPRLNIGYSRTLRVV